MVAAMSLIARNAIRASAGPLGSRHRPTRVAIWHPVGQPLSQGPVTRGGASGGPQSVADRSETFVPFSLDPFARRYIERTTPRSSRTFLGSMPTCFFFFKPRGFLSSVTQVATRVSKAELENTVHPETSRIVRNERWECLQRFE